MWRALNGVGLAVTEAAEQAGIDRGTLELMYVRISQINGCTFCLDMHTRRALDAGLPATILAQLPAWNESSVFDDAERAALAIGEAATTLPEPTERRTMLDRAREVVGDERFSILEWAAITMNAFNRVSILSEHPVRRPRPTERPQEG